MARMCVLFLCLFLSTATVSVAEIFTSMVSFEHLLYAESEMAMFIREYIEKEMERLNKLKVIADMYQTHSEEVMQDVNKHLAHPVNAFLLVKRLTSDWAHVEQLVNINSGQDFMEKVSHLRNKLPTSQDLSGSANAIIRLQNTYRIPTAQVARGEIPGTSISPSLTSEECYEIGRVAYNDENFKQTVHWMRESLSRWNRESFKTIPRVSILDYLAYATAQVGNYGEALALTKELLNIDNTEERFSSNARYFSQMMRLRPELRGSFKGDEPEYPSFVNMEDPDEVYFALCRGEEVYNIPDTDKLRCYYRHNNDPRLILQPVKTEEIYRHPRMVIFHDFIRDHEIARMKQISIPRLNRATVVGADGKLTYANYRIQQSSWIPDNVDPIVDRISQRIEAVTMLSQKTSEELQIANYGLGGHYAPHFDFATELDVKRGFVFSRGTGNRIATTLIYMTDVEAGGATVFTNLGISIFPKKGSAAFWYNLQKNGDGYMNTRHAACPVLAGNKWVSNKWIHERGQEFTYPCNLVQYDE